MMSRKNMELAVQPSSNIVCFRYNPTGKDLNALNAEIWKKLIDDGTFYIVNTTLHGKFYLWISLVHSLTDPKDIEAFPDKIEEYVI